MTTSSRSCRWKLCLASCLAISGASASSEIALAQILPDSSLGNEISVVTPQTPGSSVDVISGGATRGANLFHSFQEFSVQTGRTAFFNNAADTQSIISRVTGSSVSNIDGLIRANGAANVFLLNPNGIVFGQNARLDIGGSFIASTASSLKFADGIEVSATAPQTIPLLTVNVPIGLQYGKKVGDIRVQGVGGSRGSLQQIGLILPPDKTLALVGGNITLEGAYLNVPGGQIELGSITGVDQVNLNQTNQGWTLNYQNAKTFGNIQLSRSFVDITIEEDNSIQSQRESSAISIRASQLDIERSSIVRAITFTAAPSGNVSLDVQRLTMREGAQISTRTLDMGPGGNLTVNASESVELTGELINLGSSGLYSATDGAGQAGSLTITTPVLLVRDGAQVNASTRSSGKGGDVSVTANKVQLLGRTANGQSASGLASLTTGVGDAGSVTINTGELLIRDGATINAATYSSGQGGNLTVIADSIQLLGRSINGQFPSRLNAQTQGAGNAGNVRINTQQLLVRDGSGVFVESIGTGNAGNLTIDADSIRLDNGTLTADTRSANTDSNRPQATINLRSQDLMLFRGSNITTNATGSNVIGGNINIDTGVLVALEDSDIRANSDDFRGGRVRIAALGIFGTQFRNVPTPESDITATGVSPDLSGTVELNTLDIDPSRGLVELPGNLVDASQQIAQSCTPKGGQTSSFVATGRGGLPLTPYQPISSSDDILDDVRLPSQGNTLAAGSTDSASIAIPPNRIVEAQGWLIDKNGGISLVAQVPASEFQRRCLLSDN